MQCSRELPCAVQSSHALVIDVYGSGGCERCVSCSFPFPPLQLILSLSPLSHLSRPNEVHVGGARLEFRNYVQYFATTTLASPSRDVT